MRFRFMTMLGTSGELKNESKTQWTFRASLLLTCNPLESGRGVPGLLVYSFARLMISVGVRTMSIAMSCGWLGIESMI